MANFIVYVVPMLLCHFYAVAANIVTNSPAKEMTTRKGYRDNDGCDCANSQCVCCARVDISQINVHFSLCMTVAYIPADAAVKLEISIDGNVILNIDLSAKNPPPVCFEIPGLSKLASFCLILYNFDVKDNQFSGCARIEVKFLFVVNANIPLGCFTIPVGDEMKSKANLKIEQGPIHQEDRRMKYEQGRVNDGQDQIRNEHEDRRIKNEQGRVNDGQDKIHNEHEDRRMKNEQRTVSDGQDKIHNEHGSIHDVKVYKAGKYEAKLLLNTSVKHTTKLHLHIGFVCAVFLLYVN